jgi:hypothetical protein
MNYSLVQRRKPDVLLENGVTTPRRLPRQVMKTLSKNFSESKPSRLSDEAPRCVGQMPTLAFSPLTPGMLACAIQINFKVNPADFKPG